MMKVDKRFGVQKLLIKPTYIWKYEVETWATDGDILG